MSTSGSRDRLVERLRGGAAIAVAVVVMNVTTYAFTVFAAHRLGPQPFGALTALLNLTLVAGVLSLALQAAAARRIAREPQHVGEVERAILQVGFRASLGLGVVVLCLSPVINIVLKLHNLPTAAMLAVAVLPITLMGAQAGVLQGERRWVPLSLIYVAAGLPRLVLGIGLLAWRPDESIAFLTVTVTSFVPVVVGWLALRSRDGLPRTSSDHTAGALWRETLYNSQALLAFLALAGIDIVIARNTLEPRQAGLYAAGLIVVKAVTFAPQFVVVLAFPSMGSDDAPRSVLLLSLLLVGIIGAAVTLGIRLLPDLALAFVGGDTYAEISGRLWIFALLGTVLSMLQLLVYSVLARPSRTSAILMWTSLAALLVVGLAASSVTDLVQRVLTIDVALLATLLVISLRKLGRRHESAVHTKTG